MGACASVPKDLKAEAGAAPPPEPPKEETTTGEVEVAEVKPAEGGEKKVDGDDDKPKNDEVATVEKVADDSDKHSSLNSLMNEDEPMQELASPAAEVVLSTTVKAEEEKGDASPVYDSPKKAESEKSSTDIAEVSKEGNIQEEKTQKS